MNDSDSTATPRANWRWRVVVGAAAFLAGCLLFCICVANDWIPVAWMRAAEPKQPVQQDSQLPIAPGAAAIETAKPQAKADVKPAANNPAEPPPHVDDPNAVRIELADGEYVVPDMIGTQKVVLVGRVKRLKVGLVDGGSILDASKLEAREIIITGRIDGQSLVRLNAAGGTVELRDKVDGHSTLDVQAPGGTVTFSEPTVDRKAGSKIDGDSQITITAKTVDLRGTVNGTTTNVTVTQTKGGRLKFRELAGGVHMFYKKAHPDDPEPLVEAGKIQPAAELKRID